MNNKELAQYQKAQALEAEQLVGYWIKHYGITRRVLNNHPCISDLALLLRIRAYLKQNQKFVSKKQNEIIGNIWQVSYNKKLRLFKKHYTTLENIVLQVETKALLSAQKISIARQKIKQARVEQ
jgi:hypothetical protein